MNPQTEKTAGKAQQNALLLWDFQAIALARKVAALADIYPRSARDHFDHFWMVIIAPRPRMFVQVSEAAFDYGNETMTRVAWTLVAIIVLWGQRNARASSRAM